MTIKNTLDFYYNTFPVIRLRIEMNGGIRGKDYIFTSEEAARFIRGYEEQLVACVDFETHTFFKGEAIKAKEIPSLFIKYIPEM